MTESSHPTVPSPPHANSLTLATRRNISMAGCGPSESVMSNTCLGFNSHWNFCISLAPWFPPDLGLMNTRTGLMVDGMGFKQKGRGALGAAATATPTTALEAAADTA